MVKHIDLAVLFFFIAVILRIVSFCYILLIDIRS